MPTNMNKLNLLIVTSDKFPPFRVDLVELFGKHIRNRGHILEYVMQSEGECNNSFETRWKNSTVWVGRTDIGTGKFNRIRKNIFSVLHDLIIFRLIKKNQYDAIQIKDKFVSALFAILATIGRKTKFIFWLSFPFPEASLYRVKEGTARYHLLYYIRGKIQYFLLYKIILPNADYIFVQSDQMKKDIIAKGISADKMTPVPMGVDLDTFVLSPRQESKLNGNGIVLYLGTLSRVRRLDFMLRVHKEVLKKRQDVKLYMVGSSVREDEEFLKDEASRLGISNSVIFTGQVQQAKALQYITDADVCVSPFFPTEILNSTSPTKLVEYMAMKKAVVANDHPDQKKVISESGSGVCVKYKEQQFVDAIILLLNDSELRKKYGLLGRKYIEENRSYEKIADIVEKQYQLIVGLK